MNPLYFQNYIKDTDLSLYFNHLLNLKWLEVREARKEYFMAYQDLSYTYGTGNNAKTYESLPFTGLIHQLTEQLNIDYGTSYNMCFLNRYDDFSKFLGYHADDSPEMNHDHPIASLSFGAEREIWWKKKDYKGVLPPENKQLLHNGSLFIMPAGFQKDHFHKIPKCDKPCGIRISLTFRNYLV